MKLKKKKARKKDPLAGDRTPTGQLYRAVRRYIEANGGSILVIGGVQLQSWPGDSEFKFTLGVRCMGKRPTQASASREQEQT